MIWEYWLQAVADTMHVELGEAGIIMSLLTTVFVVFVSLLVTKFSNFSLIVPIVSLVSILCFSYMGWFPAWTGSILALVFAYIISRRFME